MARSPVVILYDASGKPLAVTDGSAIPASTPAILLAGANPDGNAKYLKMGADGTLRMDPTGTTTQPISAASLPLPSGAATETGNLATLTAKDFATQTTLALIKAKTDNLDVMLSTRTKPSDTQAISATALPLPSGAATESGNLATLAAKDFATQTTLALIKAKTDNLDVMLSSRAVTGLTDTQLRAAAVPVSGPLTDVQLRATAVSISAAALPLPSGAATEITQALQATAANQTNGTQKSVVRGGAKGTTVAADVTSENVDVNRQALHVKVVGGGGGSAVDSNVNIVDPSGNNIATADGSTPTANRGLMIEGYEALSSTAHRFAVDSLGRMIIAPSGAVSAQSGFAFGDVNLTAVTSAVVRRTAYTEQTANAQRSIASASASDAAAGTGARQVKITYLDQTGAGPYTEIVTLNGTSYVNTTAVNICFIEKMEVVSVGSGGVNAGIITLKAATAGGGATIGTVAAGDNRTFWTHHYVPVGKTCYITSISCSSNSSVAGNGSLHHLKAQVLGVSNTPNVQVSDFTWVYGQSSNVVRDFGTPIQVVGPAHVEGWVTTSANNNIIYRQSFDYYDQ